jgi:predicted DNA-binding transcriptional regulator
MTGRTKSNKAKRQEERLLKAQKEQVAANIYQSRKEAGENVSYMKIAVEFGISKTTLRHRVLSEGLTLSEFNATKQKLTPPEEDTLVTSILEASRHGFPPTHHQIAMEADSIQSARLGESFQPVGKQWVNQFLRHHNKLVKTHWSAPLSTIRAQSANPHTIRNFLNGLVKREVVDKGVPPELLY